MTHGSHPDLTWVVPSGAHEMLVSDIDGPVIAAATRTPFEAQRRVFVIERADELGEEAANRMLKTLEEPADFVHIVLLTDRLAEILPTIRSRCQMVRFESPSEDEAVAAVAGLGVTSETARACVRLALRDADRAPDLVLPALLHMHHVRAFGVDADHEERTQHHAREIAHSLLARRKLPT